MATTTTSAPQQGVNMPAVDLRQMLGAVISSEGVRTSTDLQVTQRAAGANLSVDVAAGSAAIQDDHATGGGFYAYTLATATNVPVGAADASNPRIDRIVIRVRDSALGDAANDVGPVVVAGTASAGANLTNLTGAAAVPDSSLLLANVLVGAAASTVPNANIDSTSTVRLSLSAAGTVPAGVMFDFGATTAPTGYLLCDGSAVSRTTFAALFTRISTLYGAGDGSTTFNLPDFRGRVAVGYAASGGHANVSTIAANDGQAAANRRPQHRTSLSSVPRHTAVSVTSGAAAVQTDNNISDTNPIPGLTVGTGNANDALDAPSYIVVNKIIKT